MTIVFRQIIYLSMCNQRSLNRDKYIISFIFEGVWVMVFNSTFINIFRGNRSARR
jgi:hypothetical protein